MDIYTWSNIETEKEKKLLREVQYAEKHTLI
ncbi:uncharacterized protein G2W53_024286 [Senna tora]|uniref:Uncharacterized protein n=1 Tax=Senna tora TaxID=362788 RepID=A0A834TCM4_9FABA|nr:uncharacterized protein G2W53_024286 [Senna tora]